MDGKLKCSSFIFNHEGPLYSFRIYEMLRNQSKFIKKLELGTCSLEYPFLGHVCLV